MRDFIIFLIIYLSILFIGSNTGGNMGLSYGLRMSELKKSNKNEPGLKDIFKDLFLIISSLVLCIIIIYYFQKHKIIMFLLTFVFLIVFTINFIKNIKQYINNKIKK